MRKITGNSYKMKEKPQNVRLRRAILMHKITLIVNSIQNYDILPPKLVPKGGIFLKYNLKSKRKTLDFF